MGCRSVRHYMRLLTGKWIPRPQARPAHRDAGYGGMAMRTIRQRHPRSPLAMTDQAVMSVARGLTQRTIGPSFPPPLTLQRVVESPAHHPEETEVVDAHEPRSASTWLSPCQALTDVGSKSGPADEEPNDGKEEYVSLPASELRLGTLRPGPS